MMTEKKYRVHNWVKFNYSEIGEYIGEDYTDKPLRNDEIVDLLNEQHETIQSLISDSEKYRKLSIQFDNRNKELVSENALLEKENEQLKSELENCRECLELNRESCARHMKENEQLKSKNLILKGKLHQLRLKCGKQEEEIECLSEETIEKFRQDLQDGKFLELTAKPNVRKHPNDHIGWKGDVE